jgi:hypothetical protein
MVGPYHLNMHNIIKREFQRSHLELHFVSLHNLAEQSLTQALHQMEVDIVKQADSSSESLVLNFGQNYA